MKVIKPKKLNKGDTIGIVASSLPVLPVFKKNYEQGKKVIKDLGFKIKEGETIGKQRWWMAGTPKEVAEDINNMFADKGVKAIMAQTGGYSAISVLEHLDYELITQNIKPFVGMSDMTAYHLAIFAKTGMVGFHMDDVTFGLGMNASSGKDKKLLEFDEEMFIKFLTRTDPPGIIKPLTEWEEWKKGKAKGHLIGGILQLLTRHIGTPYFPKLEEFDGAILFWEEVGKERYEIARCLYQLKYAGILDRISGMLIGKIKYVKPIRDQEVREPEVKDLVLEILKDYKFPIMQNLDFGHFTVNIPMPIGTKVEFDTKNLLLNFLESPVS
ncbi:LD-carboxypeptidase [Candidatus Daviesbacteria bacterium]|nr:LD-carboxypeptidase [Candidatus Daviesbacteria bacterium]